jgi:uncharacterized protein (TIGR00369 family)
MLVSLEELRAYVAQIPINEYFQVQVLEIGEGYCKSTIPYNPILTNFWKNTHGGVYTTVSDMTFFWALATLNGLDLSGNFSTVEIKTNFLSPSKENELYAEARVIKNGKRNVFGDVSISDSRGKILSHSTVTYARNNM